MTCAQQVAKDLEGMVGELEAVKQHANKELRSLKKSLMSPWKSTRNGQDEEERGPRQDISN